VSIDNQRLSAVFGGPVIADWKTVVIGISGGFTEQCERADRPRSSALHLLFHASVGDHQAALVEHVVAHQIVDEVGDLALEFG
jgi:hypothetical protein